VVVGQHLGVVPFDPVDDRTRPADVIQASTRIDCHADGAM
jgi:hypothetical protein